MSLHARITSTLAALFAVALVSCESLRTDPRSFAPAQSSKAWKSPKTTELGGQLLASSHEYGAREARSLDTSKVYSLPDLIDLAQSRNASTKMAWEMARGAAASIGLAKAEYYPMLAVLASYGGGYMDTQVTSRVNVSALTQRTDLLGTLVSGVPTNATLNLDASAFYLSTAAGAKLKWLLFDFGGRRATLDAAQKATLAANLAFNATHQAVAFKVVEAYALHEAARREVEAARVSAESAEGIEKAAQAKFDRGLITEPELLQVKQMAAESAYALVTANSHQSIAYVDLSEAAVIPPGVELKIASPDTALLSASLGEPLDAYIQSALLKRPDLLAKLAVVQAREAELRKARTAHLPTLNLLGTAGYVGFNNYLQNTGPLSRLDLGVQNYGAFLTVQWPVFTGGLTENGVRLAESKAKAADEELTLARDKTVAEVWKAYVKAKNAISSRSVTQKVVTASKASYDSAIAGYDKGVVSNQEILLARSAYVRALALRAEADAAVLGSLGALALGSGRLDDELLKRFR